jgi:hypothetical protein
MTFFLSPPNRCCGSSCSFCGLPSSSLATTLNHNLSLRFLLVASSLSLRSPAIAKKERTKRSVFTSYLLTEIDQRLHLPSPFSHSAKKTVLLSQTLSCTLPDRFISYSNPRSSAACLLTRESLVSFCFLESLFLPLDRLANLFSSSRCMYLEPHIINQQTLQASISLKLFLANRRRA